MKFDFENDESLRYVVVWSGILVHYVRFASEEEAIDFAASLTVAAHVYSTIDFKLIFANIHSSTHRDL